MVRFFDTCSADTNAPRFLKPAEAAARSISGYSFWSCVVSCGCCARCWVAFIWPAAWAGGVDGLAAGALLCGGRCGGVGGADPLRPCVAPSDAVTAIARIIP